MKNTLFIQKQDLPDFYFPSHTITWDAIPRLLHPPLSKNILKTFTSIYKLADTNPKQAFTQLLSLKIQAPTHPAILNLLSYLYLKKKKFRTSDALIVENFSHNPHHLCARINYADQCLRRKQHHSVLDLFNHHYNLRDFAPHLNQFHISEFRGFVLLMGNYFLCIGKYTTAEYYHYLAHRVAPNHPGTHMLTKKLDQRPIYKKLLGMH